MFNKRERQLAFLSTATHFVRILIPVERNRWIAHLLDKPEVLHKTLLRAPAQDILFGDG